MKVKIDIVSGFLGSGKTSLIKKLLTESFSNEKVVVIENEFGKIGIDGSLLKNNNIQVMEISSGCICCSVSGDLVNSLIEIIDTTKPDRIIIEPSGVALLGDLLKNFSYKEISDIAEINMIITVVDAVRYEIMMSFSEMFIKNQIENTKTIIFSKTSGADDTKLRKMMCGLTELNGQANIITTDWTKLSADRIIEIAQNDYKLSLVNTEDKKIHTHNHCSHDSDCCCHHTAEDTFESWEIETAKKFSRDSLASIFKQFNDYNAYGVVLRGKGILESVDSSWIYVDYVPGELNINQHPIDYSGRICLIGRNLNKNKLYELFG